MITGDLKSKIDKIWEAFWTAVQFNPFAEIGQMTYLIFICIMDELQSQKFFTFFKHDAIGDNIFIPQHLVTNYSLTEGIPVQVEVEEYTDNRTNELKKNRVKRIEL
jgi:hypothetical protein